jgi:serine/threonine protein kinase
MSLVGKLIGFGFRQALGSVADDGAGEVIRLVKQHFTDHSQTLPKALARANDRTWQALGIALAGDGFLDQVKVFFASGDDKGIREEVRQFLQGGAAQFEGCPAELRKKCLAELKSVRQAGLLSAENLSGSEIARQTASFQRYADPQGLVDGAQLVASEMADAFAKEFPNLGVLLRQGAGGGPPPVVAAFAYFFRREVETDEELAHGLFFDGLRQLSASQAKAFSEVGKALTTLGDQFERVFERLDHIEAAAAEIRTVAVETHGAVLDIQAELQHLGSLHLANADKVRRLMEEVLNRVSQAGMQKGEVKPQCSFSIRSEDERNAVKQLLARFRQMSSAEQRQFPALLNGLGKLQIGSGDFGGARHNFMTVALSVTEATARAEAHFNAYRAALGEKKWADALAAIEQAATLDSQRFAPFPLRRYQVKRILGAGGFGTAFLCHDRNFEEDVVVKALHAANLERNMVDVFREAKILRKLAHSAIIGVHECEYADPAKQARPYIVMDYFPGGSLESFIQERGTLTPEDVIEVARLIAQGMCASHQQGILHRDLKPDNVLVRKEGPIWKLKIIDFGLAFRKQTIETSRAGHSEGSTVLNESVVGTIKYAPPEQMGDPKGVRPGPYSDVYSFGKLCCYALFKTTVPNDRHWKSLPESTGGVLKEMLDRCQDEELEHRWSDFEPVLNTLQALGTSRLPQRQLVVTETQQFELQIPGVWFARRLDNSSTEWMKIASSPGKLVMQAGLAYRFEMSESTMDHHLACLNRLPTNLRLMEFSLRGCKRVTDAGLAHLKGLTALQELNLGGCKKVTDAGLAHLKGLTALQELNLGGCVRVTDAGLAHLKSLTALQQLDLNGCVRVTDAGLTHLKSLTALQQLDLSGCVRVTDDGLAHLKSLMALQELRLSGCVQVTDDGLAHLSNLTALQWLDLVGCEGVTDYGLAQLKSLKALRQLSLSRCEGVSDAGLAYLKGMTGLQEVHLGGCAQGTENIRRENQRMRASPAFRQQQDEQMTDFVQELIDGETTSFPIWDEEKDEFQNGPMYGLETLKKSDGSPWDAPAIVNFFRTTWSEQGGQKYAVPLLMAVSRHFGVPKTRAQAEQEIAAVGMLRDLLEKLPQNPSLLPALKQREEEIFNDPSIGPLLSKAKEGVRLRIGDWRKGLDPTQQDSYMWLMWLHDKQEEKKRKIKETHEAVRQEGA